MLLDIEELEDKIIPGPDEDPKETMKRVRFLDSICEDSDEMRTRMDFYFLRRIGRDRQALIEVQENLEKAKGVLKKVTAAPWHQAVYLRSVQMPEGLRYLVAQGGGRRLVEAAPELDVAQLRPGDDVFLANELNAILAFSPQPLSCFGEVGFFERFTPDGRLILNWRDEEFVVDLVPGLRAHDLSQGDLIRWNRDLWMAFEKIERPESRQYILKDVPDARCDQVGGQDANLDLLISSLSTTLVNPELAEAFNLKGRQSVLMVGPPGCGKTLMARVAAAELSRISGKPCHFAVVKPSEWGSEYVNATERNIRHCFEMLNKKADEGLVVAFMDEVDAMGRLRGAHGMQYRDGFLNTLLVELDGFSSRSNVAIIAATNRKDLVDPGLLDRLSDMEIHVGRPNMQAAHAIFSIHLPEKIPYYPNGKAANDTRAAIIESAVSSFYSPNAGNEICMLRFRDGKSRLVHAGELASGRLFEQVCRQACQTAQRRAVRKEGEIGLRPDDIRSACANVMERLRTTLTPENAHAYLSDLPQDIDIVSVEPTAPKVSLPHQYLNVA